MPEDKIVCEKCATSQNMGKTCCQRYPGIASPSDFQRNGQSLEAALYDALASGKYCIDWWGGDPVDYFIRPAVKGMEGELTDPTWGGECTFLADLGCDLEYKDRPEGCRVLVPDASGGKDCCHDESWGSKNKSYKRCGADLWLPHRELIENLIEKINKEKAGSKK